MSPRVAILIDGDNVAPDHLPAILAEGWRMGDPILRRAYGNGTAPTRWTDAPGLRFVHAGGGRNAADVALAIDAVDLWHADAFDAALIASSDGAFGLVAAWLRERGAAVTGMGEAKAPEAFRQACARFVVLEGASSVEPKPAVPRTLEARARTVVGTGAAGVPVAHLGMIMHRDHGTSAASLPERSWRGWLAARPAIFALDPKGPAARVRLIPSGFGPDRPPPAASSPRPGRPPGPPDGRACTALRRQFGISPVMPST